MCQYLHRHWNRFNIFNTLNLDPTFKIDGSDVSIHFIPQLLHVIVANNLQNESTTQMMWDNSHTEINDVFTKAIASNKDLGASTRNALF